MRASTLDALTINEAAETTGWSARMLRYVERIGLVRATRSASGYRLYGPAELQRLRTLRELLDRFEVGLAEIGFAEEFAELVLVNGESLGATLCEGSVAVV